MKLIVPPEIRSGTLFDSYHFAVALVPPRLSYLKALWEECDDRSIAVANSSGSLWFKVFQADVEPQIAHAIFAGDDQVVRCDDINVDEPHRGKGIGHSLYRCAACIFEAPVIPSSTMLDGGERFWRGRTSIEC